MKWYHSVKVKLIGFFLFISLTFLVTIVITFFMMRERNLPESAAKEAALMTSGILQNIKSKQIKAEESVRFLASVSSLFENRVPDEEKIIPTLLSLHSYHHLEIISGGVWFEPGIIPDNNTHARDVLFFVRSQNDTLHMIDDYEHKVDFRSMPFYKIGKKTKPKDVAWTEVYTDPVTKVKMITVVSPIYRHSQFIGVASIDLSVDPGIDNAMGKEKTSHDDRYIMMIDNKGNFIAASNLIEKMSTQENIFKIKNQTLQHILHTVKPALESGVHQQPCTVNDTVKTINPDPLDIQFSASSKGFQVRTTICIIKNDPFLHTDSIMAIYHFPRTHWNVIIGITKEEVLARQNELFYKVLFITILLTLIATVAGYFILEYIFVKPIRDINTQLQNATSENILLTCQDKGEVGMLVENLNKRTVNLARSRAKVAQEHEKRLANEEMLMQQSKMALMGEMMDSVAHQWKQPLNALTLYSELIRNDFEDGIVDKAYIEEYRKNLQVQIDHMVNTLDEFRSFFRPNKEREEFKLIDVVNSSLFLAKDDILKHRILVKVIREDDIRLYGYPNEFKHLILNIINNAKDAFIENAVEKRLITIALIASDAGESLEICDNAGGIPEDVIDHIFEANVTTKEEGKGTGIGLYMSQQIAHKHHASIKAENRGEGACFIITFQRETEAETDSPAR